MLILEKVIRHSKVIIECYREWRMEPRAEKAGKGQRGNKAANKDTFQGFQKVRFQKVYTDMKLYL